MSNFVPAFLDFPAMKGDERKGPPTGDTIAKAEAIAAILYQAGRKSQIKQNNCPFCGRALSFLPSSQEHGLGTWHCSCSEWKRWEHENKRLPTGYTTAEADAIAATLKVTGRKSPTEQVSCPFCGGQLFYLASSQVHGLGTWHCSCSDWKRRVDRHSWVWIFLLAGLILFGLIYLAT